METTPIIEVLERFDPPVYWEAPVSGNTKGLWLANAPKLTHYKEHVFYQASISFTRSNGTARVKTFGVFHTAGRALRAAMEAIAVEPRPRDE